MSNAFSVLVGGRSWDWLRELCRPLGVQAQLLDDSALPLLPPDTPSAGLPGLSLRDLSARPERPLLAGVGKALQSRAPQPLQLDGVNILCTPLVIEARSRAPARAGQPVIRRQVQVFENSALNVFCLPDVTICRPP